jgi:hypothetical protein
VLPTAAPNLPPGRKNSRPRAKYLGRAFPSAGSPGRVPSFHLRLMSTLDDPPRIDVPQIDATPPRPAGKPPRLWRFSLMTLLVVAALACFAAAYYGVVRRHGEALRQVAELKETNAKQAEHIVALRAELGHLTIKDRSKVYLLELPTPGSREWKFRVYLPPGREWRLCSSHGQIPSQGFEGINHGWATLNEGEQTIEAFVYAPEGGSPEFVVRTPSGTSRGGLSAEDFAKLTNGGASWSSVGKTVQIKTPDENEIPLLRYRTDREEVAADGKTKSFRSTSEPTFGFLLWIEAEGP